MAKIKFILLAFILTTILCFGGQTAIKKLSPAEGEATMTIVQCLLHDNLEVATEILNTPGFDKALIAQCVLVASLQSGFSGISMDGLELLFKSGAVTEWKDDDGTDLSILVIAAAIVDNPKVISVFCQHTSNINKRFFGNTALLAAVTKNNPNPEIIKVLLEAGADPNMKDVKGKTALDYMSRMENYKSLALTSDKDPKETLNTKNFRSNTMTAADTKSQNSAPSSNNKTVTLMSFETDRVLVGIENELRHQFETHLSTIPGISIITGSYYERNLGTHNIYVSMRTSFKDKDRGLFRRPKRKYQVQLDVRLVDTSNGNKTELLTATGEAEKKVEEIFPNDDYNFRQSKLAKNNEADKAGYREAANTAMQNFCNHLQTKKIF